ncbi:sensor histidine kinase [Rhizobiaceae bacterium n13]|uniref:histidine kinase n=1 Tax=Ferirhizobium litorale TaxID=2927786 RepID=A0AAE3Q9K8_9HYPH|nr:sensor histidine kinase [Fererhizobium litorale]MDI7860697.1 sensor histidine kinase [Fererhizobium litorale]MDI7920845.1 sensor histidine kinase [Fererhizobium litorale]
MERALYGAGISIVFQSADLLIRHSENLPDHLKALLVLGKDDTCLFGELDGIRVMQAKQAVLANGETALIEVECETDDGTRTYEMRIERTEEEGIYGILSIIIEVTDTRHRERVLKTLLRELSHRTKNLLAIIQGIATQTARYTPSLDDFLTKFRGRLQSLSNSQDLVTDSSWRGAFLFDLAQRQFAPYWPEGEPPLRLKGINAHLTPNATVHLGLALHELVVNSASHGAIAYGMPSISLECRLATLGDRKAIEIVWIERLPQSSDELSFGEHNFGRTVLERVVPTSMNGVASFNVTPDLIEYRLTIPDSEYEILKSR